MRSASEEEDSVSEYLASDDDGARSSTSSFIAEEEEEEDEDSDDVSGSKEDASDEDDYGGDERPKARRQNNKGKAKASNGSAKRDRSSRSGPPDPSSVRRNDQIAQLPFRRFAAGTPSSNPAVKAPRAPAEKMQHRTDDFLFRPLSAFAPPGSPDERNDRAREDMMQQTIEAWCSRAFSPSLGDLKRMSALRLSSENPAPVRPWKRARVELPGAARQVSFFPQVTTFESEPERYNRALGPLDSLLLSELYSEHCAQLFNAGSPVSSLSWLHGPDGKEMSYLAVGTSRGDERLVETQPTDCIPLQIWAVDMSSGESKQPAVPLRLLSSTIGSVQHLAWRPQPFQNHRSQQGSTDCLAVLFEDGAIALLALHLGQSHDMVENVASLDPTRLQLPNDKITTFDWASHDRLIAGTATGAVVAWTLSSDQEHKSPRPSHYVSTHQGTVVQVAAVREPAIETDQPFAYESSDRAYWVGSVGMDGSLMVQDLRDPNGVTTLAHERAVCEALAYDPLTLTLESSTAENDVKSASLVSQPGTYVRRRTTNIKGTATSLSTSQFHPLLALATSAGICTISNTTRSLLKIGPFLHVHWPLFQLELDQQSGSYRLLTQLLPESRLGSERKTDATRLAGRKEVRDPSLAWLADMALTATDWHPALEHANYLAAGSRAGLVYIDRVPFDP